MIRKAELEAVVTESQSVGSTIRPQRFEWFYRVGYIGARPAFETMTGAAFGWMGLGLAALFVLALAGSAGWPFVHDATLMHYVAWLIDQGWAPYRDVFDFNMPGTYLMHWAILKLVGSSAAWLRFFDAVLLVATALLFARLFWRFDRRAAVWAAACYPLYVLWREPNDALQRDSFSVLALILAMNYAMDLIASRDVLATAKVCHPWAFLFSRFRP